MNLEHLRQQIDDIDTKLMDLFKARMAISKEIAAYKKTHQLPILDAQREQEILSRRQEACKDVSFWPYEEALIKEIMRLSKEYQAHE